MIYKKLNIRGVNRSAHVTLYCPENTSDMQEGTKRPLVVLCPGGAYWFVADREADPIAYKLLGMNMAVAIVRYTTKSEGEDAKPFPEAIAQVARTIAYFRRNAERFCCTHPTPVPQRLPRTPLITCPQPVEEKRARAFPGTSSWFYQVPRKTRRAKERQSGSSLWPCRTAS